MAKSPRTTKPTASDAPRAATPDGSDDDAIARRAYEIYQERGGGDGADVDDWLQAEREIRSRRSDAR